MSAYSRRKRYPAYLAWIHTLPCAVPGCPNYDIEADHIGARGLGQKCPDTETIPLCSRHHRTGMDARHTLGRRFYEHHGLPEREELIREYQGRYKATHEN